VKSQLLRIAVLTALAALVIAVWKFSFGVVWDTIVLSIFVAVLISAWILRLRMRRKIRGVLVREATDMDLASIKTWITVDEREEAAGVGASLGSAPGNSFQTSSDCWRAASIPGSLSRSLCWRSEASRRCVERRAI
jgi:hypothetical protein